MFSLRCGCWRETTETRSGRWAAADSQKPSQMAAQNYSPITKKKHHIAPSSILTYPHRLSPIMSHMMKIHGLVWKMVEETALVQPNAETTGSMLRARHLTWIGKSWWGRSWKTSLLCFFWPRKLRLPGDCKNTQITKEYSVHMLKLTSKLLLTSSLIVNFNLKMIFRGVAPGF